MAFDPPFIVRRLSTCSVKPSPPHSRTRCHLAHWDLAMLSSHYIQKGLLFSTPRHLTAVAIIERLKSSLSAVLFHFFPLAGRIAAEEALDASGIYVSIDCDGQGAEFTHAVVEGAPTTVASVRSPSSNVPLFVRSFFPLDGAVNYDGRSLPLLAVQVTELADGIFLGCCFNHVVGDGVSYWQFFKAWAEIARGGALQSNPPVHRRWFFDGSFEPPIKLPFTRPEEFIERFRMPVYRERVFHLAAGSIAGLKARANKESSSSSGATISSFQSVTALLWRCITRARGLPAKQTTNCRVACQNRERLRPPLSPEYFGNSIHAQMATATAGELLARDLGWAARLVHQAIAAHTDGSIRKAAAGWLAKPVVYKVSMFDRFSVMMGGSPRFDVYGCDFGWGRAVAARSGTAHKFDGKVTFYAGPEGGGSMDLEICLEPAFMEALVEDEEFTSNVSVAGMVD
ncbi:uncharacterized acetyltransferase At3g50280-like [Zingiber officinale]|uniref:Acetyltransferase n=1 Tax=Zingiber officinale TaxID=94328 RepID=A0A8J5FHY0_ZINOF|nr:uncharacterized acetyltransferase At3g50280-like [Zingiber officinale]KAG6488602.1 hypothetical protein ZIOFF_049849 [Zingiber officinale]